VQASLSPRTVDVDAFVLLTISSDKRRGRHGADESSNGEIYGRRDEADKKKAKNCWTHDGRGRSSRRQGWVPERW
jgi:hypothetical protein